MEPVPTPPNNNRLGFHYFPDTLHYRESDLIAWLPELHSLGASWLTLVAPPDRAIPEVFLQGLLSSSIEPILHFHLPLDSPLHIQDLRLLFDTYARWGIHYVALFDRPNTRAAWQATSWARSNLVERFLDIYLPLAEAAILAGLIPVFPPLEPGGDYWDTAFLRAALQGLSRRGSNKLVETLVLGAYAWTGNRPLNWGAGGPERWPGARPYFTPEGNEDQRGFRIFDWYLTLAKAAVGQPCRMLLLASGSRPWDGNDTAMPVTDLNAHAQRNMALVSLMMNLDWDATSLRQICPGDSGIMEYVPNEVLTCNFWLLSCLKDSPYVHHAWFQPDGTTLPIVGALRQWLSGQDTRPIYRSPQFITNQAIRSDSFASSKKVATSVGAYSQQGKDHPISHYLLLPTYEWGIADWHLEVIRPFVKKYHPTIGFSVDEACQARRVTVVGGSGSFPETAFEDLLSAGCIIEQISGDGTSIASQLAAL